jgi:hypothetical protein
MSMDRDRAYGLIDALFGQPDAAADRAVAVLNAHAAALAWARDATGQYPAPSTITAELAAVAARLRSGADDRDPVAVLGQAAVDAVTAHRAHSAA